MKHLSMTKGIALAALMVACGPVMAASWQDQLSSAASQLTQNSTASTSTAAASGQGLSLSSLTGLLNGGTQGLTSNSMSNAAGILGYCAKQKLTSVTSATNIKDQLMTKLGLNTPSSQPEEKQQDYLQGLSGLLNTGKGQQLDLKTIGSSPLAEKVKTKACDLVLKQGAKFL